jgi:hypothetical protein
MVPLAVGVTLAGLSQPAVTARISAAAIPAIALRVMGQSS